MSILGKEHLVSALSEPDISKRLIISPLLDESQIGPGSIDLRLGNEFIVTHRGNLPYLDPGRNMGLGDKRRFEHKHYVERSERFYLHPNELVLAATLEYFKLPSHLGGYVTSRSSWGRAGLVIATAVAVHPGFTGTVTLELVNLGEVPLVLYPGLCVAQFVFFNCEGGANYDGRFVGQISPQSSTKKVHEERDLAFWCSQDPSRNA
ncbi:dCTP deaminase [Burkholderia cenocepacia]|uniref:dCTP deaminase n=1 Tax=Burkholderia TaxID=32008 RepID=UPI0019299493|nr:MULTISPECIES: dCTP deaminase [Burkholderia]MBL3961293.1 dCTP deaminase [Burkholderia sp. KCJ3K979]MBR7940986.1 dCTP deaminase [Burkholderia cenocepacia]MBR8479188.1 dCTP deaminase [Burkholderia cenocepacia]